MKRPTFNESTHTYTLDGKRLPSVTQCIAAKHPLWFTPDPWYAERGTAVHKACSLYVARTLDIETVDPEVKPYLDSFEKFLQQCFFASMKTDLLVWSEKHWYAGTLDLLPLTAKRGHWLVDLKTENVPSTVGMQLAGYAEALKESHGIVGVRRFSLCLRKDKPFQLKEYSDPADLQKFLQCVQMEKAVTCERHE